MGEKNRAAFLLVVGALLSKMDRKNLVFDDEMQPLLSRIVRKERLSDTVMDELLAMVIRKDFLRSDRRNRDCGRGAAGTSEDRSGGSPPKPEAEGHEIPKVGRPKIVMSRPRYLIAGWILLALMVAVVILAYSSAIDIF
jgi:hypothetical protein